MRFGEQFGRAAMATTKFSVGDLVFKYGSPNYYQSQAGIAEEVPEAGSSGDEPHVKIRLLVVVRSGLT